MPAECKQDIQQREGCHHCRYALWCQTQRDAYLQENLQAHHPQVDVRSSAADDEVLIKRVDGQAGTAQAENLQQGHTALPGRADRQQYELVGYQCQAEHQREGYERREAQHLAEDALLAVIFVVDTGQYGLRYLCHRVGDERRPHRVPFVGLVKKSDGCDRQQFSEDEGQHVLADDGQHVGQQHLGRETEHAAYRAEVDG